MGAISRAAGGGVVIGILVCGSTAAPSPPVPVFTEEALQRGLTYTMPIWHGGFAGYGIAFMDLDADGDLDVAALGAPGGIVGLFENDGSGHFTNRSANSGIPPITGLSNITAADWDCDGDMDLVISRIAQPPLLYRNDGGFTFTDVTALSGINITSIVKGMAWGDIDGDGWPDLFLCHYRSSAPSMLDTRNQVWRNNGDGTFTDIAAKLGMALHAASFAAVIFDADDDGDLDVYLSNDRAVVPSFPPNQFYRNHDGVFVEVGGSNGSGLAFFSMGIAVGDPDANGLTDLYCTNTPDQYPPLFGSNPLFLQQPGGIFELGHAAWGVANLNSGTSWACHFVDVNHDGLQDLYVLNGAQMDALYLHGGAPPMQVKSTQAGLAGTGVGLGYCSVFGDVDQDGDPDLLINNFGGNVRLYINQTTQPGFTPPGANWAKFHVIGERHDRHGFGATVRVTANGKSMLRHILLGDGYLGQSDLEAHFGLGSAALMDQIEVRWPWTGSARTLTNYPANQRWTIHPPGRLGDFDGDGQVTQKDLSALAVHCGASVIPGLEMLDLNGDSLIDQLDVPLLLERLSGPVGDLNDDGVVDGSDLGVLLGAWGGLCAPEDLDANGVVDGGDLGTLLGNWSG